MARGGVDANRWWIVLGATLGLTVGNGPIMQFTFGVFLKPVTAALGTDRGTLSAAILIGLGCTGLVTPIVGALVDRYGIRRVSLPAITCFALSLICLGLFASSVVSFIAIFGVMGVFAAGQTPLPYAKSLASSFDRHRGLALGIAMAGVGLGTVLMPLITQKVIDVSNWRVAYVALGIILFVVAMPAMAFLIREPSRGKDTASSDLLEGWTGRYVLSVPSFWILAIAFFSLAFSCSGVVAHIVAIMSDRGISRDIAASTLATVGVALIFGRLIAGYLLDRIFGPYVAVFFFLLPLLGLGMLVQGSSTLAVVGTILVGLGLGAEVDIIAFLISRYFGMRSFGQIYGYLFAVFMLANGLGPFVMGQVFARSGGYGPAMIAMGVSLVVSSILLLRLGPYNFVGHGAAEATPHAAHAIQTA